MNYRNVFYQLGLLLLLLSVVMLSIAGWESVRLLFGQSVELASIMAMLLAAGAGGAIGGGCVLGLRTRDRYIGRREALLLVAMSWMLGAAVAALPFWFWAMLRVVPEGDVDHIFIRPANCYFEAMSGLTTTGATVLSDIQQLSGALIFWRSTLHWLGGLGIVVLFVAVLPSLGVGGKRLFRVEAPGPAPEGLQPTIRDTARVLLYLYGAFTVSVVTLLFLCTPMSFFDSVCHALSTVSTGGLSPRDASIGHYDSVNADIILSGCMLLAGVNFALFFQVTQGRWRGLFKDTELRVYLAAKVAVILIVTFNIYGTSWMSTAGAVVEGTFGRSLRDATFVTIALQTGTGFCTTDYDGWPELSRLLLVGLMFVGGCAGSTAGGLKVIRMWIAIKIMIAEIEKAFRPNVVRPLRVGQGTIDHDMKQSVITYALGFLALFLAGTTLLVLIERGAGHDLDFVTAVSSSLSTLANVGPGLHRVGATENYGWYTDASKIVMSVLMALGRLEVFALIVLFLPRFWRGD